MSDQTSEPEQRQKTQTPGQILKASVTAAGYQPPVLDQLTPKNLEPTSLYFRHDKTLFKTEEYRRAHQPTPRRAGVIKQPTYDPNPIKVGGTDDRNRAPTNITRLINTRRASHTKR